jgi:hypothetical protein
MKRLMTIVCISVISSTILFGGGILWIYRWLSIPLSEGIAIHLVIKNLTNQEIGPFAVSDTLSSTSLFIAAVEPRSTVVVDFVSPEVWGENEIVMTDPSGQQYTVIGYFEHSIKGRVDIIVVCASSEGLLGRQREITSYFSSLDWLPWGISDCGLPLQ